MAERNTTEIKVWMMRQRPRLRVVDICADLGFHSKTVQATLTGAENNRKVLAWLVGKGCPKKYLALPGDMRAAA